jgi:hypothetical protein
MAADDSALLDRIPTGPFVVICGRADDAAAWLAFLGPHRCHAISLDDAPQQKQPLGGASAYLDWHHRAIEGIDREGWLAGQVRGFDPVGAATLIIPDPLDPLVWGQRRRIGARQRGWRRAEDKTVVDSVWDAIGLPRARSLVVDAPVNRSTLETLGALVDEGTGVVCSRQPRAAGPTAGGDGIWWWLSGHKPPAPLIEDDSPGRLRLMPLLPGLPVRVHGLVLGDQVVPFPAREIVSLPRPGQGAFLCAGTSSLEDVGGLASLTRHLGDGLREHLDFRGGFSVDGVLTGEGFRPTDFNARLTSAMEAAPPAARVRLHAVNVLARERAEPPVGVIRSIVRDAYASDSRHTLYGASSSINAGAPSTVSAVWRLGRLVRSTEPADVTLTTHASPRGWLITGSLDARRVPPGPLGCAAPAVFRLSDQELGTDFGPLRPAFGLRAVRPPTPRRADDSAESSQRAL